MNFKRLFLLMVFVVGSFTAAVAGEPGTASGNFLKMPVGAGATAMGGAVIALGDDVYSSYWNPAGLGGVRAPQIALMYNASFENIFQQYAAYAHPTDFGVLALGVYYVGAGDIQGYDAYGKKTANVDFYNMAGGLSFQRNIIEDLSGGLTLKYIQEKLEKHTGNAFAADIGLRYILKDSGLKFGAGIKNVGTPLKFIKEEYPLPMLIDFGVGYKRKLLGEDVRVEVNGIMPSDNKFFVRVGAEVLIRDLLALRVGYDGGYDAGSGLNAGVGLGLDVFLLDYGYRAFGEIKGMAHRISLTVKFKGVAEARKKAEQEEIELLIEEGKELYAQGKYAEAILKFNRVLRIDFDNAEALDLMKKAGEKLR